MTKTKKTNVFFLGLIVFYLFFSFYGIALIPERFMNANMSIIIGQSMIAVPTLIYVIGTKGSVLRDVPFRRIGLLNIFLLFILTYCMLPVVSLLNSITMMFAENHVAGQLDSMNSNPFLLNIFLVAVLPAFLEELTFRGILFGGYRKSGVIKAAFASGLLFGLFHMNINQFCYAFFMGIVFAMLREATGTIHASMIVHFIFNANSVVMLKILDIFRKYVNKMAAKDEEYRQLADQLNQAAAETATSYADYSLVEKLQVIFSLGFMAVGGTVIGVLVFWAIKVRCQKQMEREQMRIMQSVQTGNRPMMPMRRNSYGVIPESMKLKNQVQGEDEKVVDCIFVLGIIVCVLMMIYVAIV